MSGECDKCGESAVDCECEEELIKALIPTIGIKKGRCEHSCYSKGTLRKNENLWSCDVCGTIYHKYYEPTKKETL